MLRIFIGQSRPNMNNEIVGSVDNHAIPGDWDGMTQRPEVTVTYLIPDRCLFAAHH